MVKEIKLLYKRLSNGDKVHVVIVDDELHFVGEDEEQAVSIYKELCNSKELKSTNLDSFSFSNRLIVTVDGQVISCCCGNSKFKTIGRYKGQDIYRCTDCNSEYIGKDDKNGLDKRKD